MNSKLKRGLAMTMAALLLVTLCAGCNKTTAGEESKDMEAAVNEATVNQAFVTNTPMEVVDITEESVPLSGTPAVVSVLMPQASGTQVQNNGKAIIDYSNAKDGYIMVQVPTAGDKRIKVKVKGPSGVEYTYDLRRGVYETLPLSDGNGNYKVTVFENVSGTSYATILAADVSAQLKDQFAPFLLPNQYVNYSAQSQVVSVAASEIAKAGAGTTLQKVEAVYKYVVNNFTYDKAKAQSVQSGYLPNVDTVLASKKGICFDYAAVMAAMLRSQGIPTKLVVGFSKDVYHAWINVYTPETGWVEGAVFFDGQTWKLMDPTFASSAKQSKEIMDYIGNGANYSAKYLY